MEIVHITQFLLSSCRVVLCLCCVRLQFAIGSPVRNTSAVLLSNYVEASEATRLVRQYLIW